MGLPAFALLAATSTVVAPRIDLITIGVGDAMYAIYGHAAIRVVKPGGEDVAYNFGGVDMKQPGFWLKLMQGRIDAYLEVTPYSQLLLAYSGEDRSIVGRTLAFTPQEAHRLVARLDQIAASPEKFYLYHHIFDNCSTRVAEAFDEAKGGALKAQAQEAVEGTHRDWILDRIKDRPWVYLAMDLAGNGQGDRPIKAWDTIFIPEAIDKIVDGARFEGRPFVVDRYVDYTSLSRAQQVEHSWPWILVYLLLVAPLSLIAWFFPRVGRGIYGLLAGVIGLVYVGFWIGSDYEFYHRNWNLLVFPPTHFLLLLERGDAPRRYVLGHGLVLTLLAIAHGTGLVAQSIAPMLAVALPVTLVIALAFVARRPR